MRKLFMLILVSIIPIFMYSQKLSYPKVLRFDNDTIIALTPSQLTKINLGINRLYELTETNELLNSKIEFLNSINKGAELNLSRKDSIISDLGIQIYNYRLGLKDQKDELDFYKDLSKKKQRVIVIGGITVSVGVLLLLIFK